MSGSAEMPPKRTLTVTLADLELAFEATPSEANSYLDLETVTIDMVNRIHPRLEAG